MRLKRIVCMLMITMLVSSCKLAHELALSKKPTTDEIVLTEVEPEENIASATTKKSEELPERIAGHKVTYTDDNATEQTETTTTDGEASTSTNWLLIALIGLPPLCILILLINKKIAKKLNENG